MIKSQSMMISICTIFHYLKQEFDKHKKHQQINRKKLCEIPYVSKMEYLCYVVKVIEIFKELKFHLIQSNTQDLNLKQFRIRVNASSKIVGFIQEIFRKETVVSLNFETDNEILYKKQQEFLKKYNLENCAGNLLQNRRDHIVKYNKGGFTELHRNQDEIVESIIEYLQQNIK
ncbi:unnamed protein product [Paramecium octaurelia]|uniref:Uncharacterized protein n=1 Tax=Paramecium octaurelia TaxID=43137 RepID=A0A8S1USR3_PAROT|nr:unnamed protein product [Paramecium octaurelia]